MFNVLGIRHHGPGSARSLLGVLAGTRPDLVLIEGPADASESLQWLVHEDLEPPVALVSYRPDTPKRAAYLPLAVFSPEFVAARYALQNDIPVRFFDLPQSVMLAADTRPAMPAADPMTRLAQAAGHKHYERWWNDLIEQRRSGEDVFDAVLDMMRALREDEAQATGDVKNAPSAAALRLAQQREAQMRSEMRRAQGAGYKNIAVVCGAYHGPALADLKLFDKAKDDALLANLPQVHVEAAWVPWSYGRMSSALGYGAGVVSPGWYHHLWETNVASPSDLSASWLTRVSTLLRAEGLAASSANIIEAVRLAESLAALRDLPFPGLQELSEATQSVLCFGDAGPLKLIRKKLIVSERLGAVPSDAPAVPLERDLRRQQRQLKLRPTPEKSTLSLDVRNELDLQRSVLLQRLRLLDISWGEPQAIRGRQGTSHEIWTLEWKPELALKIIEANLWGNTVAEAAHACVQERARTLSSLQDLSTLLDSVILADLPDTVTQLLERLRELASLDPDVLHLMLALAPLSRVLRYGSVRSQDKTTLRAVVDSLVTRICVLLPASRALNDEAAAEHFEALLSVNASIKTLGKESLKAWHDALALLSDSRTHGLLAGRACRILVDAAVLPKDHAKLELSRQFSAARDAAALTAAAFWLDGFLRGSGLALVHDRELWRLLDDWLLELEEESFTAVLPLLRRTFSSFSASARQQLSDLPAQAPPKRLKAGRVDEARADALTPLIEQLLGLKTEQKPKILEGKEKFQADKRNAEVDRV